MNRSGYDETTEEAKIKLLKKRHALTQKLTAFKSFNELLEAKNYRPSLRFGGALKRDRTWLADQYDIAQALRNDSRRAA